MLHVSPFLSAARKAVSRLRRALGFLPTISAERIELALRKVPKSLPEPPEVMTAAKPPQWVQDASKLQASPFVLSPELQDAHSMAQQSSALRTLVELHNARDRVTGDPPPEPAPGVADNLRDAINFALDDHNPDGLEWLRAWNDGDECADQELHQWRARQASP